MDSKKFGMFIAELRKKKNLTQEKLGEMIGASGKTVSKWERGVNAPDISKFLDLSEILGVSVNELLRSEYASNVNDTNDDITIKSIQYYTKKTKTQYIKVGIYTLLILCMFFLALFTISNFNKVKMYSISSKSSEYYVEGYIIYNQKKNLFLIKNIDLKDKNIGTDIEEKVSSFMLSIVSEDKNIFSVNYESDNNEFTTLNSYLLNKTYFVDEVVKNQEKILTGNTNLHSLKIIIEYKNINGKIKKIEIPLKVFKEYSNDKLIY